MSVVMLTSGGLDSTVMARLAQIEGLEQFPLFIDYGQLNRDREYEACKRNMLKLELPEPAVVNLSGFGAAISSGLTDRNKRVREDAFLPCRNLLFLTAAAAYAQQREADAVSMGLLDESHSLFPDQTSSFLRRTEALFQEILFRKIRIVAPLMQFTKKDIVRLAKGLGIADTYSCHAGGATPCGQCIACREFIGTEV